MAYVEADYLVDVLGSVTEFETLGWIVYIPKLGRNIILSPEMYNALDEQEMLSDKSKDTLNQEALSILDKFAQHWNEENNIGKTNK